MHEPASRELIDKLEQFTACRERDLVACRRHIQQLSRDLPAFDSLWLDALVQARKLTPFQADCLTAGHEQKLQVGPYQLVAPLLQDRLHARFLGRHPRSGEKLLIEEHRLQGAVTEQTLAELFPLRDRLQRLPEAAQILQPKDFVARGESLFAVYPYVRGLSAREVLIRRGRFPEKLVRVVTQHLLAQLKLLASEGILHGDIRASNLLLCPRGQLLLLNTGLRPLLSPHWTLQTELPFEAYDTFPPEVVRTGQWTVQADQYSAGCLLWQLACGRPPLHSADALLKLKAHLTRNIPDPREYAPDLDAETADVIFRLTRRDSTERLKLSPLRNETLPGSRFPERQALRRFISEFEQPLAAPVSPASSRGHQPALLTAACCLTILCGWIGLKFFGGADTHLQGARHWLLSIAAHSTETQPTQTETVPNGTSQTERELQPLPKPDPRGRLQLTAGEWYQASDVASVGPLLLTSRAESESTQTESEQTAAPRRNAVVVVTTQAWRIWATELQLENITIQYQLPQPTPVDSEQEIPEAHRPLPPAALLVCQSMNFTADECRWEQAQPTHTPLSLETATVLSNASSDAETEAVWLRGIAWRKLESNEINSGQLRLTNCVFDHAGSSLMLGGAARSLQMRNCLKLGPGDFLELADQYSAGNFPRIVCEHVTLRQASSFLHLHFYQPVSTSPAQLAIQATNCVFDLHPDSSGLIQISASEHPRPRLAQLDLIGQIVLLNPHATLIGWSQPETGESTAVDLPGTVEGILVGELTFAAGNGQRLSNSELQQYTGPRWGSAAPGILMSELPTDSTDQPETK